MLSQYNWGVLEFGSIQLLNSKNSMFASKIWVQKFSIYKLIAALQAYSSKLQKDLILATICMMFHKQMVQWDGNLEICKYVGTLEEKIISCGRRRMQSAAPANRSTRKKPFPTSNQLNGHEPSRKPR
jgi:hypothetical protein